ncbi:MAG TPA: HEAT repeat domain-containing protein [Polyangiaceae bacterium]|nr:HEAT repeat domain-containing protein [Polyangiaceae bacterium]
MSSIRRLSLPASLFLVFAAALPASAEPRALAGRAKVYEHLAPNSLERISTPKALLAELKHPNVPPTRLWQLLEHGEKVECLACIPHVSRLLYSGHAKNREIAAWWLRRRIFGVFGPGEVYSQVVSTLTDASQSEERRAYAANALGEFLNPSGIKHVARAIVEDESPLVRRAAVEALQRLNHEGPSRELGSALSDPDESVRLAALRAATSIHVFSSPDKLAELLGDESPAVRKRAAEALGALKIADAVVGLVAVVSDEDESPDVTAAAIWALGQLGDPAGKASIEARRDDPNPLIRSAAAIALRRL